MGESPNPPLFTLSFQKRSDEDLQFDYVLLLHEMVSQVNNFIPKKTLFFLGVLRLQVPEFQLRHRSDPAG